MYNLIIKRTLDLLLSIIAFPIFLLLFAIISVAIKLDDGGPVFYNAERLGKDGKTFIMYKFRSMKVNAPDLRNEDGSTFNSDSDSRVTNIGSFLRKTSLDEIPQIINVIKGDMSIVGPRPHIVTNYKGYDYLSPEKQKRLEVRPGITGYSQAFYRNSIESEQKIENDCFYVDNLSFCLDLQIFIQTIRSVLRRENINTSI